MQVPSKNSITGSQRNLLPICLVVLIALLGSHAQAQKNFSITLEFPQQLANEKLSVSYDNGIEEIEVEPVFTNNRLIIAGKYYAKFASVEISSTLLKQK